MSYLDETPNLDFILNENSEYVQQPPDIDFKLKPHQLVSIHRMIKLDYKCNLTMTIEESECETINTPTYNVSSNIGILGDFPGSGKTITMLSAISLMRDHANYNSFPQISSHGTKQYGITICKNVTQEFTNSTLIVVPTNLIDHWEFHLKKTKLTYEIIVESEINNIVFDEYDIILCPAIYYNKLIQLNYNYRWNRVVFDEADSIQIPNMLNATTRFLWLITSTYLNMPKRRNRGFLRNIFDNIYSVDKFYYPVIIKCNPDFVKRSFSLQEPFFTTINCIVPEYISALHPFLSDNVINCINSGNIQGAIFELGGTVDSPENIILLVTKKINNQLLKARSNLNVVDTLDLDPDSLQKEKLRLTDKLKLLESRKEAIISSIKDHSKNTCPICLDVLANPTVIGCCSSVFCGSCLLEWSKTSPKCPLCRESVNFKELTTIGVKINKVEEQLPTKIEAMLHILKMNKGGRFLIFVDHSVFKDIGKSLTENNYKYGILTTMRVTTTLTKFIQRELNIILLSPQHNGAGIEIPQATDVILFHEMTEHLELQTIGRAQRPNRIGKLNVWKLRYTWER